MPVHLFRIGIVIFQIFLKPITMTLQRAALSQKHPIIQNTFSNIGVAVSKGQLMIDSLYNNPFQNIKAAYKNAHVQIPKEELVVIGGKFFFECIVIYGFVLYFGIKNAISSIKSSTKTKLEIEHSTKDVETIKEQITTIEQQMQSVESSMNAVDSNIKKNYEIIDSQLGLEHSTVSTQQRIANLEAQLENLRKLIILKQSVQESLKLAESLTKV